MNLLHSFLASLGICLLLAGCLAAHPPVPKPTITIRTPIDQASRDNFRIIGYAASWDTVVSEIQFDKLTHINYAFLLPKVDGTFKDLDRPDILKDIITYAHKAGGKVLISVGGWGLDDQFEHLAADPKTRSTFVTGLCRFVSNYSLDGADIDWEYPDAGPSSQNFLALMRELRSALPKDRLLTAAVVALGENAEGIPAETFGLVDFLNLMVYDGSDTNHSPYTYAVDSLNYWSARGLLPEKTVLGVPFYSRPDEKSYKELVQANPLAANLDEIDYAGVKNYYNGIPTMQRKTLLALQRASGMMIWELSQDTSDSTSLLNTIYQTAHGK